MRRRVPLKNIVRYGIAFAGQDKKKLNTIYEFIVSLVERRLDEVQNGLFDVDFRSSEQKKIELKLDDSILQFVDIAEKMGKSASGLLCELICEKFKIEDRYFKARKPRRKKSETIEKTKKTISFKIPMRIYSMIESNGVPMNRIIREMIHDFLSISAKDEKKNNS